MKNKAKTVFFGGIFLWVTVFVCMNLLHINSAWLALFGFVVVETVFFSGLIMAFSRKSADTGT